MEINWDDYVPYVLEAEKENEASPEILAKLKSNLTDKIAKTEESLKKIVTEKVKIYNIISDTKPVKYEGLSSLLRDGKSVQETRDKCLPDNDSSNFHDKFSKIAELRKAVFCFVSLDRKMKNINSDFDGYLPNITYEALYNGGTKKYRYNITTFSSFYASYFIWNIDYITDGELSFHNYNKFAEKSSDAFNKITMLVQDSESAKKQKILFRYLMERGTGISFAYFLYKYAILFYDELINEEGISKSNMDHLVNEYLLYMTMFKSVCLFPDDDFFGITTKFVTRFIRSRNRMVIEANDDGTLEAVYTQMFYDEIFQLVNSLFEHQEKCLLDSKNNDINIDDNIFTFPKLSNVDDKKSHHQLLWQDVLGIVRLHVGCDNPADSLDLKPRNSIGQFETITTM